MLDFLLKEYIDTSVYCLNRQLLLSEKFLSGKKHISVKSVVFSAV